MDPVKLRPIGSEPERAATVLVVARSFATVADEFGLTKQNCPTHAAFFTREGLDHLLGKGARFLGAFVGDELAGCVAVEASPNREGVFYLEKLAVLPAHRHRSIGLRLMEHAFSYCRERGGRLVSIALIDAHAVLKQWYQAQGFATVRVQTYPHLPFQVCFMERPI